MPGAEREMAAAQKVQLARLLLSEGHAGSIRTRTFRCQPALTVMGVEESEKLTF